jgi:hypothetical protein
MADTLTPQYLDMDYATMKRRLQEELAKSDIFKDYNYEGSNITLLIELISYLGALTTYYLNKVAKNQYIDTADIYETVHMLSRLRGYDPQGYRSAKTDLTVSIYPSAGISAGDQIRLDAWKLVQAPTLNDADGNLLRFATITSQVHNIPSPLPEYYQLDVPVRQGRIVNYSYKGSDLVDNALYLPFETFDYDDNIEETDTPSIQLTVNDELWDRVVGFYDEVSGLQDNDNVFMLRYDKYEKYVIEFSSTRNVPADTDTINITMLVSAGVDGAAGANTIIQPELNFIHNDTTNAYLDNTYIPVTNLTATTGSSAPENIDEIKAASTGALHSQYRNVTKIDYISHLEARSDIVVANVWGEQDIAPSGSIQEYNKVHITVIPDEWGTGTIATSATSGGILTPLSYSNDWKDDISVYIEPRKMLCAYEQYDLPDLVYFRFDIGIKVKRTYSYTDVMNAVRNKLIYYFSSTQREFNDIISFLEIQEYITDSTQESITGETWPAVKGIQSIIIRNIDVPTHTVYEPNTIGNYPKYTVVSSTYAGDENQLRKIEVGFNQFPMLDINNCTFSEEF